MNGEVQKASISAVQRGRTHPDGFHFWTSNVLRILAVLQLWRQTGQKHLHLSQTGNINGIRSSLTSIFGVNMKITICRILCLSDGVHSIVVFDDQNLPNHSSGSAYSAATFCSTDSLSKDTEDRLHCSSTKG